MNGVEVIRATCLGTPVPWAQFGLSAAFVTVVFVGGCLYFRKAESDFADLI